MPRSFAEELLVLVADAGIGSTVGVPDRTLRYALAGAALMDLALANRIDTDPRSLFLIDPAPLGDDLLDPILEEIAGAPDTRSCEFWVRRITQRADELRDLVLERLVEQGILETDDEGAGFALTRRVARSRRYPAPVDREVEWAIHPRLMDVLFSDDLPSPRDSVMVGLVHACGLFRRLLTAEEYDEVEERIELLAGLELVGQSVTAAIRNVTLAESQAARRAMREQGGGWPRASGRLPVLGHAHRLAGDLRGFCTEQYLKHGPVFEVTALGDSYVVMAGQEANLFMKREGKFHMRTSDSWQAFTSHLGVAKLLIGLEGADHRLLRRTKRNGYSRGYISERMPEAVAVVDRELAQLSFERPIPVVHAMTRIMVEQITLLTAGVSSRDHIDDLIAFSNAMHGVTFRRYPRLMMRTPPVRRARRRLELLIERGLDEHESKPKDNGARDLIDDLLDLHRSSPDFLAETDMFINAMGPFLVGMDTVAATTSFALYALLKHPDLLEQVRREADDLFAAGDPTIEGIRRMTTTRNFLLETMRMWPIAHAIPRTVANSFEFGGYLIPYGTKALIATSVTHALPEFFPDPERFDINRYSPERREHLQHGAFVPFGLGHHGCLGQGFAEVQMVLTVAALLHQADIALDPPGYRLKIQHAPGPRPDRKFSIRLSRRR